MVAGSRRSAQHDKRLAQSHPLKPVAGLTSLENRAGPGLSKKVSRNEKNLTISGTGAPACENQAQLRAAVPQENLLLIELIRYANPCKVASKVASYDSRVVHTIYAQLDARAHEAP